MPSARIWSAGSGRPGFSGGYVFGGESGSVLGDLWEYRALGDTTGRFLQSVVQGDAVLARAGASVVWDERNQRLIIYGGRTGPATWSTQVSTVNFYDMPGK